MQDQKISGSNEKKIIKTIKELRLQQDSIMLKTLEQQQIIEERRQNNLKELVKQQKLQQRDKLQEKYGQQRAKAQARIQKLADQQTVQLHKFRVKKRQEKQQRLRNQKKE